MPRLQLIKTIRRFSAALLSAITLATALCATNLVVAAPAGARPEIGIADQSPATFLDPRFAWLGIRRARLVVPWDVTRHRNELVLVDAWLKDAQAHHLLPLVVFDHGVHRAAQLPSVSAYARAVRPLLRRYPWVTDYSAWNEENHAGEPTAHDPRRAAQYFNELSHLCRSCAITAADVLDEPNMASWVSMFLHYARHPRVWGLHNYFDLNHGGHRQTQLLLRMVPGQVWFTETGGLVWRYDRYSRTFVVRGERYADRAARRLLGLAALSPRIRRIYYYHWRLRVTLAYARRHRGGVTWDSGLFRPDCSARPALTVIARAQGRNASRAPKVVRDRTGACVAPKPAGGQQPPSSSPPPAGTPAPSGSPPPPGSPPPGSPPPPPPGSPPPGSPCLLVCPPLP